MAGEDVNPMAHNIAQALFSDDKMARFGERIAIRRGDRAISYGELADLSRSAGDALLSRGASAGDRILFRALDTEHLVAGVLGAMGVGLVPVILSPRVSEDDIRYVTEETGAGILIEDDELGISRTPATRLAVSALAPSSERGAVSREKAEIPKSESFWLYSSGTTGRMKGVIHGHHDLAPVLGFHEGSLGVGPGSSTFCTSRISFAYATSNGLLAPLALGATVVLQPHWPTPESTLETIEAMHPDVVFSVPSMYRAWLDLPADRLKPMSKVGRFVSAGEHLPVPIAERWRTATGATILDCYGCSETCFLVFASPSDRPRAGSVGFPCRDVETVLRDEQDRPVGPGKAGRLFIRHPFLALSYGPAAPIAAQARFRDGWFNTGDIFRCDEDGYWHHYGREDDWLKIAGQWVSLRGIEEVAGTFAEVDQVVGVTANDTNGFLRITVFAVPVARSDRAGLEQRLQDFLGERLPAFKRPKWVRVVQELPRTSTGKIKKGELRRMIEDEVA
ncbi:MAG: AMP-binding protein [Rhodospirillales bacterium]|nr:AMP-binding protein [Rhodospirillales bacterium]